jgi:hypothetical protein
LILNSKDKHNNSEASTDFNCETNVPAECGNGGGGNMTIINIRITIMKIMITFWIE